MRMKLEYVIKKLQELNSDDYRVGMEVEPIIDCVEQLDGTGWETTKYRYTIVLEGKEVIRPYKNHYGVKEYLDSKGEDE